MFLQPWFGILFAGVSDSEMSRDSSKQWHAYYASSSIIRTQTQMHLKFGQCRETKDQRAVTLNCEESSRYENEPTCFYPITLLPLHLK